MPFKNFVAGNVLAEADLDDYLMRQTVMTFASTAARDAAVSGVAVEGMMTFQADTDTYTYYTGAVWVIVSEPVQAWTPTTVTQSVSVNVTAAQGWYQRHRGVFHAGVHMTVTSSGTAANVIVIPTPVTLSNTEHLWGNYNFFDASASTHYSGPILVASASTFTMSVNNAAASLGGAGFTGGVASSDVIRVGLTGRYA